MSHGMVYTRFTHALSSLFGGFTHFVGRLQMLFTLPQCRAGTLVAFTRAYIQHINAAFADVYARFATRLRRSRQRERRYRMPASDIIYDVDQAAGRCKTLADERCGDVAHIRCEPFGFERGCV